MEGLLGSSQTHRGFSRSFLIPPNSRPKKVAIVEAGDTFQNPIILGIYSLNLFHHLLCTYAASAVVDGPPKMVDG